jgi:hypothetical protein
LLAEPGEAGDLGVEGGQTAGGDSGTGGVLEAAAGSRGVGPDEMEMVGAAADVLDGEAAGEEFADQTDPGHVGGGVLALAGGGAGRRREQSALFVEAQGAGCGAGRGCCVADPHLFSSCNSTCESAYNSTTTVPRC